MTVPATRWQDLLRPGDATDFFMRRAFPPFDPDAAGYRRGNALWLAELSRLVYRHDREEDDPPPQPTRTGFLQRAGFAQRHFFVAQETGTQAMLVECDGAAPFAVLVFRGTEQEPKDFIADLEVGLPPFEQAEIGVHAGFRKALDSVWNEVHAALSELDCPVFYTGHSLGAALATLAAARRAPRAVYTFGSPRVGNRVFVESLARVPVYRIVDDEDLVATVPSEALGFRHAGVEQRLTAPRQGWSFLERLRALRRPPKFLADHAPVNYVDRIPAD